MPATRVWSAAGAADDSVARRSTPKNRRIYMYMYMYIYIYIHIYIYR